MDNRKTCPKTPSSFSWSYCFYFDGYYCSSTAEYIFLKMERCLYKSIEDQPFVFLNRRPDFFLNNQTVLEIKDEERSVSQKKFEFYKNYGVLVKENLGYDYNIRFMKKEYPKEYKRALTWLRANATRGSVFTLLTEI